MAEPKKPWEMKENSARHLTLGSAHLPGLAVCSTADWPTLLPDNKAQFHDDRVRLIAKAASTEKRSLVHAQTAPRMSATPRVACVVVVMLGHDMAPARQPRTNGPTDEENCSAYTVWATRANPQRLDKAERRNVEHEGKTPEKKTVVCQRRTLHLAAGH